MHADEYRDAYDHPRPARVPRLGRQEAERVPEVTPQAERAGEGHTAPPIGYVLIGLGSNVGLFASREEAFAYAAARTAWDGSYEAWPVYPIGESS